MIKKGIIIGVIGGACGVGTSEILKMARENGVQMVAIGELNVVSEVPEWMLPVSPLDNKERMDTRPAHVRNTDYRTLNNKHNKATRVKMRKRWG